MAAYTTIDDPEAYFQAKIYTGNGSADNAITFDGDTDMQPDLVWIKNREQSDQHCLFDAVRGATKVLHPDATDTETTDTDTLDAFQSDGFRVDADVKVNTDGEDYVAWCWKESATAGFDILTYTGTGSAHTISHNLSALPHLMIHKGRSDAYSWITYHHRNTDAPETDHLVLEANAATADSVYEWNDTSPTTSVWTVGGGSGSNENTKTYVAYLWSEKQGFSKFGLYTGNGNADGPFCYCGFKPAVILLKKTSASGPWIIFDNKRPFQASDFEKPRLVPSATGTDTSSFLGLDFLANGFKLRETDTDVNGSGVTYIFIAFAESPLVNSEGVPTTGCKSV